MRKSAKRTKLLTAAVSVMVVSCLFAGCRWNNNENATTNTDVTSSSTNISSTSTSESASTENKTTSKENTTTNDTKNNGETESGGVINDIGNAVEDGIEDIGNELTSTK